MSKQTLQGRAEAVFHAHPGEVQRVVDFVRAEIRAESRRRELVEQREVMLLELLAAERNTARLDRLGVPRSMHGQDLADLVWYGGELGQRRPWPR